MSLFFSRTHRISWSVGRFFPRPFWVAVTVTYQHSQHILSYSLSHILRNFESPPLPVERRLKWTVREDPFTSSVWSRNGLQLTMQWWNAWWPFMLPAWAVILRSEWFNGTYQTYHQTCAKTFILEVSLCTVGTSSFAFGLSHFLPTFFWNSHYHITLCRFCLSQCLKGQWIEPSPLTVDSTVKTASAEEPSVALWAAATPQDWEPVVLMTHLSWMRGWICQMMSNVHL